MILLTVSNWTFGVCCILACVIGFVGGCIWYSSLKEEPSKVEPKKKEYADIIDIDRAIFKDNTYEWKKNN